MAVDDVLLLYGETRRRALSAYRRAMSAVAEEEWCDESPGHLPWWKLGRPTEEDRALRRSGEHVDELGRSTARWRPRYGAREWVDLTVSHLGADRGALAGRGRSAEVVWQRDLIGLVGIERYGVKVKVFGKQVRLGSRFADVESVETRARRSAFRNVCFVVH